MNDNIKISIIITSYNYENYISETIDSVISQSYDNWEIVIVDDGSKDNSVNLIREYCNKDDRIKLFQHPNNENRGIIESIKLGISKASSEWIVFLESDDSINSEYLDTKVKLINKYPNIKLFFNDVNCFGDSEKIKSYEKYFKLQKKVLSKRKNPDNFLDDLIKKNIIPTFSVVMVRKDIIENADFDSPVRSLFDYYLWIQIAMREDFYYVDKKLTNWRIHPTSYINKNINIKSRLNLRLRIIQLLWKNKILKFRYFPLYLSVFKKLIISVNFKRKQLILFGKYFDFTN